MSSARLRLLAAGFLGIGLVGASVLTAAAAPDPVLVGAGDIATCDGQGDEQTAALLDQVPGTVFTAGDNAYSDGTHRQYQDCYGPSWGRHRARTKPSPGNHERDGDGYLGYFDGMLDAGHPFWYSYDLGSWHIISLDSDCGDYRASCGSDSAQLQWLRADLATTDKACVAAYWHHPRFSSGDHGNIEDVAPFWRALYDAGADVVINGHDHSYERFDKQDPQAQQDPSGIREFVVGTGGADQYHFNAPQPNSQARITDTVGVLKLTLHAGRYTWQFVTPQGVADAGSDQCSGYVPPEPKPQHRVKITLRPVADTNLYAAYPNRNGGSARILHPDASPVTRSLLRFNPANVDGTPVAATLRLWVSDGSRDGPLVRRAQNAWLESKVTWSNRPSLTSRTLDDLGAVKGGRWVSLDVTRAVTGDDAVSFALLSSTRDAAAFSSRETRKGPQLVVTVLREGS